MSAIPESIQAFMESTNAMIKDLQMRDSARDKQISDLQSEIQELKRDKEELRAEVQRLVVQAVPKDKTILDQAKTIDSLQRGLDELRETCKEIPKLKARIAVLEEENSEAVSTKRKMRLFKEYYEELFDQPSRPAQS